MWKHGDQGKETLSGLTMSSVLVKKTAFRKSDLSANSFSPRNTIRDSKFRLVT